MLVKLGSEAEAHALKMLEPVLNNVIKEVIIYSKDCEFFQAMGRKYGKGIKHNVLEIHVNDAYVDSLIIR